MRVERARPRERPVAPDVAQQLVLREHAVRLGGERGEQLVLLAREAYALAADGHQPRERSIASSPTSIRCCGGGAVRRSTARIRATSSS